MRLFVTEQEVRKIVAESLSKRFGVKVRHFNLEASTVAGPEDDRIFDGFATDDFEMGSEQQAVGVAAKEAEDGSWPWCDACNSYHHPANPTCKRLKSADVGAKTADRTERGVSVDGTPYDLFLVDGGRQALVRKGDGTTYSVRHTDDPEKSIRTGRLHGYECSCPDFAYRHAGEKGDGKPCKHLRKLEELGMRPVRADETDPGVTERVLGHLGWNTQQDASLV